MRHIGMFQRFKLKQVAHLNVGNLFRIENLRCEITKVISKIALTLLALQCFLSRQSAIQGQFGHG